MILKVLTQGLELFANSAPHALPSPRTVPVPVSTRPTLLHPQEPQAPHPFSFPCVPPISISTRPTCLISTGAVHRSTSAALSLPLSSVTGVTSVYRSHQPHLCPHLAPVALPSLGCRGPTTNPTLHEPHYHLQSDTISVFVHFLCPIRCYPY